MKITLEFDDREEVIECSQAVLIALDENNNIVSAFSCDQAWLAYTSGLLNAYTTRSFEPILNNIEASTIIKPQEQSELHN